MANRIFNTWMGDPSKVLLLETIINTIAKDSLHTVVKDSGKALMNGLVELQVGLVKLKIKIIQSQLNIIKFY